MGRTANGTSRGRLSSDAIASLVVSGFLLIAAFAQAPGKIVPETKLDITLDPIRYLGRALSAWDPSAGFGRIQNQAVGYLFPMGPFFALGQALGVPPWITQRLWLATLLIAGYWGANRLARALGVATVAGRVVAGLAYTLSAASLGVVAFQSAGQLPYAMAPWVLVPLVGADSGRGARRTAAWSALAIAAMGGVNGASTLAVLPLVAVWFTTRQPGPDRRRLMAWWAGGAVLATVWWVVALGVSVRYGLRFTAFTEQSTTTTSTESATEIWRGTGNWLAQLDTVAGRWLPGAWSMVSSPVAVVATLLLAAGGALGLARRDAPGRAWLLPSVLLGAAVMGIGYGGSAASGLGSTVQSLLDGPLVVFRNVHKFSAVVRLPLAIGLGHLVSTLGAPAKVTADAGPHVGASEPSRRRRWAPLAGASLAIAIVLLAAFPLVTGSLTAPGSFDDLPSSWREAAAWVDARHDTSRTLVLPDAAFAENTWGRPLDEPWGVLVDGSWAVRDLIPLGGNGSTRLLDGLDRQLTNGSIQPGFVASLQRAGIGYVVVRNDLDPDRSVGPSPATVRQLLGPVEGLTRVAGFGDPLSPAAATGDRRVTAPTSAVGQPGIRPIEIYRVSSPASRATAYPAKGSLIVGGSAEAMAQLPPSLTTGRAAFVGDDAPTGATGRVLTDRVVVATDTARRRDVDFGSVRDNATFTLQIDEPSPFSNEAPRDRWADDEPGDLTVARMEGARSVTSNGGHGDDRPDTQPFAAFDGDPATVWAPSEPYIGRWVELDLGRARAIGAVKVTIPETQGARVRSVSVITDGGTRPGTVGDDGTVTITPAPGPSASVRVRIDQVVAGQALSPVGIADISFGATRTGSLTVSRPLQAVSAGPAAAVSLDRSRHDPFDRDGRDEDATLDRLATLRGATDWTFDGSATPVAGAPLLAAVDQATAASRPADVTATGSPGWRDLPTFAPARALDGDVSSAWVNQRTLTSPQLTFAWLGPVTVRHVTITQPPAGTDPIRRVEVIIDQHRYTQPLPRSGVLTIPPTLTDHLTLVFNPGTTGVQQVGVAEVKIDGLGDRATPSIDRAAVVDLACGSGPALAIDGTRLPTRARTTVGDLLALAPVAWTTCSPKALTTRDHRITTASQTGSAPLLQVDTLFGQSPTLVGPPASNPQRATRITRWGSESRTVTIAPGTAAVLTTSENENPGWQATLDGHVLTPVRVDGWRQGFLVPAGRGGTVELRFTPARPHHAGLALGALGLLVLVAAALVGPRPTRAGSRAWTPPGERPWADLVLIATGVVVGLALGGPVVLVFAVLLLLPDRTRWLPVVIVAGLVGAGAVVLIGGWDAAQVGVGTFSATAQVLSTVAWLALAASAVSPAWPVPRTAAASAATPEAGSTRSSRGRSGRRWPRSGSTPEGTD